MDWRLSNCDTDFKQWTLCGKCHQPVTLPKTLPCLHTACASCLCVHNRLGFLRFKETCPKADPEKYLMPCPVCSFPCYLPRGPNELMTNKRLMQIIYRERVAWWRELAISKVKRTASFFHEEDPNSKIHLYEKTKSSKETKVVENGKTDLVKSTADTAKKHNASSSKIKDDTVNVKGTTTEVQGSIDDHVSSSAVQESAKDQDAILDLQEATVEINGKAESHSHVTNGDTFQESNGIQESSEFQGSTEAQGQTNDQGLINAQDSTEAQESTEIDGSTEVQRSTEAQRTEIVVEGTAAETPETPIDIQIQGSTSDDGGIAQGQGAKVEDERANVQQANPSTSTSDIVLIDHGDETIHWPWEDGLDEPIKRTVLSILTSHWKYLYEQFLDPLEDELTAPASGSGSFLHWFDFELSFGSDLPQCLRACAIAVNPATGNVMVVDNSLCKGVFFDEKGRFFGHKMFKHPVMDCSFLPVKREFPVERFCAMGRKVGMYGTPALLFVGPVNDDPDIFHINEQNKLGDITGFHCVDGVYFISMGNENRSIWRYSGLTYKEISNTGMLRYPTHITNGMNDEIIIADTGNHRIAIFAGHNYDDVRFIGKYGHEDGEFFWPLGVAVDKLGRLFVCDANNYRVQVFNADHQFESVPLKYTYRISPLVSQDVKPIDCAIDTHQRVLILFRGKGYLSLQCLSYEHPTWCVYPSNDPPTSGLSLSCMCCCYGNTRSRSGYERL